MSETFACYLTDKLLSLSGADKKTYLQGQLTQDVNLINNDNMMWAGQCDAKGKLIAILRLFTYKDDYYAITSSDESDISLAELKKYAVFSKVALAQDEKYQLIAVWGKDAVNLLSKLAISFDNEQMPHNQKYTAIDFNLGKAIKLDSNRYILSVDKTKLDQLTDKITITDSEGNWREQAILAGEPALNSQSISQYVPQMVNLQALDGISFKKGCYKGQETVARMKFLGKNKRAMFILEGQSSSPITVDEVELQLAENWRRAGKIIQTSFNQHTNTVNALAILPNDIQLGTLLRTKQDTPVQLKIKALPYSLTDQ